MLLKIFNNNLHFLIEKYLVYNVMLVSDEQHSGLVIFQIVLLFFFLTGFYNTLSIVPSRSHWLSIYSRVYILISSS